MAGKRIEIDPYRLREESSCDGYRLIRLLTRGYVLVLDWVTGIQQQVGHSNDRGILIFAGRLRTNSEVRQLIYGVAAILVALG